MNRSEYYQIPYPANRVFDNPIFKNAKEMNIQMVDELIDNTDDPELK